jgi:uncharacterized protein (TIGR03435 family)
MLNLHESLYSLVLLPKGAIKMVRITIPAVAILAVVNACGQAFEVASVRPGTDATRKSSMGPAPGGKRFTAHMPLLWLIASAYDTSIRQVSGLPAPLSSKQYDIEATCAQLATRQQMMRMLQTLLEDRFHLSLHRETKDLNVYVLTVAKGGPKLNENKDGAILEARNSGVGRESYRNFPMSLFANILAGARDVDDTVVNKTGLTGSYDFTLEYTPERVGPGAKDGHEPPPNPDGPSLFTALREQLGLELSRQKVPVELLTVDHIEEPSVN